MPRFLRRWWLRYLAWMMEQAETRRDRTDAALSKYYVNDDPAYSRAIVHRADCQYSRKYAGSHGWRGPYSTRVQAFAAAAYRNRKVTRGGECCFL